MSARRTKQKIGEALDDLVMDFAFLAMQSNPEEALDFARDQLGKMDQRIQDAINQPPPEALTHPQT